MGDVVTRQVVLATNNAKKLAELRRVVADAVRKGAAPDIEVLGLVDVAPYPEPAETEPTFEGNALIKARVCAAQTGLPALADDSGIEVDVLNNMPGVRSARWAGTPTDAEANNALLLRQIDDVPADQRGARFVCAMAFVLPGDRGRVDHGEVDHEQVIRGTMAGRVLNELRGSGGFGYDPLFQPAGEERSLAELSAEEKDAISHRGQAVRAIVPLLVVALSQGAHTVPKES
ncbi:MAG: non-canonical purine NTP pyrophosphatase [Propionibacteriales bacterium]|nr:non-canonical purine NTP pyrophosphatase [Propionibacteriales bacterium]